MLRNHKTLDREQEADRIPVRTLLDVPRKKDTIYWNPIVYLAYHASPTGGIKGMT